MSKKLGRNAPCHCGSGLKYKKCHEGMEQGRAPFRLPGRPDVWINELKMQASLFEAASSPVPEWLLALAKDAAEKAQNQRDTLLAILLVVTAGEAVVNRLLEPLVSPEVWQKVERNGLIKKWKLLYEKVPGLSALVEGKEPLVSFSHVADLRHALVHFKHGENLWTRIQPVESHWSRGAARVDLGKPCGNAKEKQPTLAFREVLDAKRAPGYFQALRDIVAPVLEKHPSDEFRIRESLKAAIQQTQPRVS